MGLILHRMQAYPSHLLLADKIFGFFPSIILDLPNSFFFLPALTLYLKVKMVYTYCHKL